MYIKLASIVLLLGSALATTSAPQSRPTASSFQPGSDKPSDPATTGYFQNKIGISVSNLTRSMDFYSNVFGFRHMFTYHLTPVFSITYMGHSSGGRNGTGYQTTEEMIRNKNNNGGHIELIHLSASQEPKLSSADSFRHLIGIIVPDVRAAQARLEKYGVEIYKKIGEPWPTSGPLGNPYAFGDATNLTGMEWIAIQDGMARINLEAVFAADPDGNLLELLPAEETILMDG
ncbi:uncharacterized protein FTOL_06676 [Fusarium torulosum]|uniref:VOC domain-containing protein n=1 Tax=Fusarium torulosum TaxID=33205 RepID=A0AAE8M9T4_9HYPO|nr:uncharacterized protein FTOL_06676 [Fusarium torulosum]